MLHALRGRAREDREAGFTLIEVLVAMVLMAIVMSSLAVFFIGAQKSSSALRMRQAATVLGDSAMDQVHSVAVDQLVVNRDAYSAHLQWLGAAANGVDTSSMTELDDTVSVPLPPNNTGADPTKAALPTVPQLGPPPTATTPSPKPYLIDGTQFKISYYLGQCWVPNGGGNCTTTGTPATAVSMDRVVVAVNWTVKGSNCPLHLCAYVVGSLISTSGDPTFNVNEVLLDTTPPSTVTLGSPGCTVLSDTSIKLNDFSAASDASGIGSYKIWHGQNTQTFGSMSVIKTQTGITSYTDTGLIPNTTYWYVVTALDTVGNESAPELIPGTITNPQQPFMVGCTTLPDTTNPISPVSLSGVSPSSSTITLTWPAGSDDDQILNYLVYRSGVSAPVGTLSASTLTFTDTGLSPWTNYTYQIKAVDRSGNVSTATNPTTTVRTLDTIAPSKPALLSASAKPWPALEIDLDWQDSSDDVAVTGYTIWRSATSATTGFTQIGVSSTSSYVDTAVAASKPYWYYVTAHDAVPNTSAASTVATASTPDTTPPTAPNTPTSPTKTASTVTLNWSGATDNVGVTGYQVFRNGVFVTNVPTGAFVDTGLTDLTTFIYTVKAFDAAGNLSPASNPLSVKTLDGTPPTAPTLSSSTHTMTSITLNWTASTDNLGVTGYAIYEDGGSTAIANTSGTTLSYVDNGEAPGTTHTYIVKAYDAAGNYSVASNTISVTTTPDTVPPTKVLGLKGTSAAKNSVTISWNASTDTYLSGYRVYSNGSLATTVSTPTLSQLYTGLPNSTVYNIQVYAFDTSNNQSPVSATLVCTVTSSGNVSCT